MNSKKFFAYIFVVYATLSSVFLYSDEGSASCSPNPCQNGASCLTNSRGEFTCNCPPIYIGEYCQHLNQCHPDLAPRCQNSATCTLISLDNYTCDCTFGFKGRYCELVDHCVSQPCENGATCIDGVNSYTCHCPPNYTGPYCDKDVDECSQRPSVCKNAYCMNTIGSYICVCRVGWTGDDCSEKTNIYICPNGFKGANCTEDVNECEESEAEILQGGPPLCEHNGACVNTIGSFYCKCAKGFTAPRCEVNIDECESNPCQNDATCLNEWGQYSCICMAGFTGINCETHINDCLSSPCHHGRCIEAANHFMCKCHPGYTGTFCETEINECQSNPCQENGTICIDGINSYTCKCSPGFTGTRCETNINECASSPCYNAGICIDKIDGFECQCQSGYVGRRCEGGVEKCELSPCNSFGTKNCVQLVNDYRCECEMGFIGKKCQIKVNYCANNPCLHDGACITLSDGYKCICENGFWGENCEKSHVPPPNDAELRITTRNPRELDDEENVCHRNQCKVKAGNKICNKECNRDACNFDGGDCSVGTHLWVNCKTAAKCQNVFGNGVCNMECNSVDCQFDGFDCEKKLLPCKKIHDEYCLKNYANGHCNPVCNNEECNFDGLDCEQGPPKPLQGNIIIIINTDPNVFKNNTASFVREIGRILHSNVRIKRGKAGHPMIYPWRNETSAAEISPFGTELHLEIDNRRCNKLNGNKCFQSVGQAAEFLAAASARHTLNIPYDIKHISVSEDDGGVPLPSSDSSYLTLTNIIIIIAVIVIVVVITGVLMKTRSNKAKCKTWFPDGFLTHFKKVEADDKGMRNFSKQSGDTMESEHSAAMDNESGNHQPAERKNADGSSDSTVESTSGLTQPHYDALRCDGNSEVRKVDVNVPGPGRFTQLMVESCLDTSGEDNVKMIKVLLEQGAEINMRTEHSGETSLHLAARYGRTYAAKALIDAGADINVQDNNGRTPLHSAVAANEKGVFQMLLRNRTTNLNTQCHCGKTPLFSAILLDIGVVDDLINAGAVLNIRDELGRTELHWAASVNNVHAIQTLLRHGVQKDAQDENGKTPLFLAATEGRVEAVTLLLHHFANRNILDNLGRLPRDVAVEKKHHHVVRLLDEIPNISTIYGSPSYLSSIISNSNMNESKKSVRARKRPTVNRIENLPSVSNAYSYDYGATRRPSVKKCKTFPLMTEEDSAAHFGYGRELTSVTSLPPYMDIPSEHSPLSTNHHNEYIQTLSHENLPILDCSYSVQKKEPQGYSDVTKMGYNNNMGLCELQAGGQLYVNNCNMSIPAQECQTLKLHHPQENLIPILEENGGMINSQSSQYSYVPEETLSFAPNLHSEQSPFIPDSFQSNWYEGMPSCSMELDNFTF